MEGDLQEKIYPAFNPRVIKKRLKRNVKMELSLGASLYLAGVLSYLTAEVLTSASRISTSHQVKRKTILPSDLRAAVSSDEELARVFSMEPEVEGADGVSGGLHGVIQKCLGTRTLFRPIIQKFANTVNTQFVSC